VAITVEYKLLFSFHLEGNLGEYLKVFNVGSFQVEVKFVAITILFVKCCSDLQGNALKEGNVGGGVIHRDLLMTDAVKLAGDW
jgi:hypothetical protein